MGAAKCCQDGSLIPGPLLLISGGGGVSGPQQGGEGASAQHLVEPLALGAAALGSSALLGGLHLEDQPSLIWDSPARDRT